MEVLTDNLEKPCSQLHLDLLAMPCRRRMQVLKEPFRMWAQRLWKMSLLGAIALPGPVTVTY